MANNRVDPHHGAVDAFDASSGNRLGIASGHLASCVDFDFVEEHAVGAPCVRSTERHDEPTEGHPSSAVPVAGGAVVQVRAAGKAFAAELVAYQQERWESWHEEVGLGHVMLDGEAVPCQVPFGQASSEAVVAGVERVAPEAAVVVAFEASEAVAALGVSWDGWPPGEVAQRSVILGSRYACLEQACVEVVRGVEALVEPLEGRTEAASDRPEERLVLDIELAVEQQPELAKEGLVVALVAALEEQQMPSRSGWK